MTALVTTLPRGLRVAAHSLRKCRGFVILPGMKASALLTVALLTALPAFAQYSATTLTRKVVPQQQPPPRPAAPQYAPQPAAAVPPRPLTEKELVKAQADKSKNEVKQFDFYKRRAEEGSDDAQFQLGLRYLTGKGTDPNEKLAREWFGKSAKQGHEQAKKKLDELGPETPAEVKSTEAAAPASAPTASSKPAAK
jgi:TPR repeat protein